MVSFRFPFSFSEHPRPPFRSVANASTRRFSAAAALSVAISAAAAGAGMAFCQNSNTAFLDGVIKFLAPKGGSFSWLECILSNVGFSFSVGKFISGDRIEDRDDVPVLSDFQRLLGVGVRRKAVLGLKNIDVYAFGVYADDAEVKKVLIGKYGELSGSEVNGKQLKEDLIESNISMTIRLQIVYGRLSIGAVRSAFEESVGARLKKFGGSDDKELLKSFTSLFKDEYKIPKGSIIDLCRDKDDVLRTTIDGVEVGRIESKLLCMCILDLYIGNDPFDRKAKEDVENNLASLFGK